MSLVSYSTYEAISMLKTLSIASLSSKQLFFSVIAAHGWVDTSGKDYNNSMRCLSTPACLLAFHCEVYLQDCTHYLFHSWQWRHSCPLEGWRTLEKLLSSLTGINVKATLCDLIFAYLWLLVLYSHHRFLGIEDRILFDFFCLNHRQFYLILMLSVESKV